MGVVMPQSLDALIVGLDVLVQDMAEAQAAHADALAAVAPAHRAGAVNLVDYTTLRRHDRRELQNRLTDIGVTSLSARRGECRREGPCRTQRSGGAEGRPRPVGPGRDQRGPRPRR